MKPIRPDLLIHTITYKSIQKDRWGEEEETATVIEKVRVEPIETYIQTSAGEKVMSSTTVFWDKVHSTPCTFKSGDKIIFDGTEMTVQKIDRLHDRTALHHLEIRVI